jgi:cobalamin biosynthesis protein CobT
VYNEDFDMTTQQFDELKRKLRDLTDSQLKSLQGEISLTLNKKREPVLSSEEREMISQLFS